jgi:hypothetical protein
MGVGVDCTRLSAAGQREENSKLVVLRVSAHMQTPMMGGLAGWPVERAGWLAAGRWHFCLRSLSSTSCESFRSLFLHFVRALHFASSSHFLGSHTQDAGICAETTGHARGSALFGTTYV